MTHRTDQQPTHIEIGRRLLKLSGVRVKFDAQFDAAGGGDYLERDGTRFTSCPLDDPQAETFTHYLHNPDTLSTDDEIDLSYYNACAWDEAKALLEAQIKLVRERFPDQDIDIVVAACTK